MLALALMALLSQPPLDLQPQDRIVVVGNTFAERMLRFGHLEAMLTAARPELDLTFRNLGWSGDTVELKPRPASFGSEEEHLHAQHADVILACYGSNAAFGGEPGIEQLRRDLDRWVVRTLAQDYARDRSDEVVVAERRPFPGIPGPERAHRPLRIVLVGPIAHERLGGALPEGTEHDRMLERCTEVMRKVAAARGVSFVDLYHPTRAWMDAHPDQPLTINGIHLSAHGDWVVARMLMAGLGQALPEGVDGEASEAERQTAKALLDEVRDKGWIWFKRWRPVNGAYVYGGRREPFGVVNFPAEMAGADRMIADLERQIAGDAERLQGRWDLVPEAEGVR